jgi:hypothetical protein
MPAPPEREADEAPRDADARRHGGGWRGARPHRPPLKCAPLFNNAYAAQRQFTLIIAFAIMRRQRNHNLQKKIRAIAINDKETNSSKQCNGWLFGK